MQLVAMFPCNSSDSGDIKCIRKSMVLPRSPRNVSVIEMVQFALSSAIG